MTDLKPCPFCGGYAEDVMRTGAIVCVDCSGSAGGPGHWNRRATHAAEPAPVAVEGSPERVWLASSDWKYTENWEWDHGTWGREKELDAEVEYIRADLAPTGNMALVSPAKAYELLCAWSERGDLGCVHLANLSREIAALYQPAAPQYPDLTPHPVNSATFHAAEDMEVETLKALQAVAAPQPTPEVEARDERLEWLMRIMAQVQKADSTDHPSNWVLAFCEDRGNDDDTFNVASGRGLIRSWYDGDTDHGECEITDAGKEYAALARGSVAEKGERT